MHACQRHLFNIPEEISYLNGAYLGPLLKASVQIGTAEILRKSLPYTIVGEDFFNPLKTLKQIYASFLNVDNYKQIAYIPSSSYGLANVCNNIKMVAGKKDILIVGEQFPSNYYPWSRLAKEKNLQLKIISAPDTIKNRARLWNEQLLEAITDQTLVVSMAPIHWADGTVFDLQAIRKRTHEVGALLILDGTQAVGAMPFDVKAIQPDALICAAYKWLLGPYGSALAYYSEYFNDGLPIEDSWMNRKAAEDFQNLVNYQEQYESGAIRYNVGQTSNFIYVQMLTVAIKQLIEWTPQSIQNYCDFISKEAIDELRSLGCVIEEDELRGKHLFGVLTPKQLDLDRLKALFASHNIFVSYRGPYIRISPNVYNDKEDMKKLVACVKQIV